VAGVIVRSHPFSPAGKRGSTRIGGQISGREFEWRSGHLNPLFVRPTSAHLVIPQRVKDQKIKQPSKKKTMVWLARPRWQKTACTKELIKSMAKHKTKTIETAKVASEYLT
jgi:hypothetical protein